ncbi:hypothetical protein FB107DRAFT_177501, partial [Schizophyllum commune]
LCEETQLNIMFPGPHEPTLKQLNNAMREYKDDLAMLYKGKSFDLFLAASMLTWYSGISLPVLGENGEVHDSPVHCLMLNNVSNLPASRKTSALAGCTSIYFMCPLCPSQEEKRLGCAALGRSSRKMPRNNWYLKYSFRSKDLGIDYKEEIFNRHGVRYSVMHELPNWLPGITGVIDYMHCTYLCMIKHLCKDILLKTGMIDSNASSKMEAFYKLLIWPPSVSCMPPSISRGAGSIKANNWKTQIVILFVALFAVWQVDGEIPTSQAPPPPTNTNNAKALETQQQLVWKRMLADYRTCHPDAIEGSGPMFEDARMDRSYRTHYNAVLEFSAAIAILSLHAISPNDVKRGTAMHSRAVQAWARMHCYLTPYFHLVMHFEEHFYHFWPCTGWWAFPYERNNGFLGCFNNNGHLGGELECTMMRGWWKTMRIQELITHLESMPAPPMRKDAKSIQVLKDYYQCAMGLSFHLDRVRYPKYSHKVSLRATDSTIFLKVWTHLRAVWAANIDLIHDCNVARNHTQVSFYGYVQSFSHLWVNNRQYGAVTTRRGFSARYGYIDHRIPVQTQYIFCAEQVVPSTGRLLHHTFAVVCRFSSDRDVAALALPWDLWATDLGVRTWRASALAAAEVVSIERLSGQFVLAPVAVLGMELWITVAYD